MCGERRYKVVTRKGLTCSTRGASPMTMAARQWGSQRRRPPRRRRREGNTPYSGGAAKVTEKAAGILGPTLRAGGARHASGGLGATVPQIT